MTYQASLSGQGFLTEKITNGFGGLRFFFFPQSCSNHGSERQEFHSEMVPSFFLPYHHLFWCLQAVNLNGAKRFHDDEQLLMEKEGRRWQAAEKRWKCSRFGSKLYDSSCLIRALPGHQPFHPRCLRFCLRDHRVDLGCGLLRCCCKGILASL